LNEGIPAATAPLSDAAPKVRGGGRKAYLAALATAQAAAFVRSVVLARLLGPEQMGLAAIIILTAQFFDQITDTGNDRFLVQDRFGDNPKALQLIHLVAIFRGSFIAVFLMILAEPIARFTGAPATTAALAILAIVPFLNGFTNFGFRVAQRHHQFGPEAKVMLISELCGLIGTTIAAFAVRNFTAVLYGLAARALASVIVSHLVVSVPYRPRFSKEVARRLWQFSAPLLANGLLIFIATQSDRVIISRYLGLAELGRYTVVLLLGLYPSLTLIRFVSALYLPLIAGARDCPSEMRRTADRLESGVIQLAVAVSIGFAVIVPFILPIIFGSRFASTTMVVTLLGLVTSWRMMKGPPTTVALAVGRTKILTINNLLRLSGIGAAIVGVYLIGGLKGVAAGLIAGEVIANAAATVMVCRSMHWNLTHSAWRYVFAFGIGLLLIARAYAWDHGRVALSLVASIACVVLFAASVWRDRNTVREVGNLLRRGLRL
jgi:O-antigen/teichoic acid export membrane protein